MQAVAGLSERELARVRGRLVEFSDEMFESMGRKEQRRWGECYLRGLMLDGKRKSIEPIAARLADGDEQCLQQFVNQSPWDPVLVRRALGFIAGEQDTPGAPWRIRLNDQLRALFVEDAPPGYVPIVDAMRILGVSRQTVLQRVKRGELEAIHVRNGRRKGLRILVPQAETALFDTTPMNALAV